MTSCTRFATTFLLAAALPLAGCEMLGGGDKGKDGESIGYACRVSNKLPEDCMKENNTYAPTAILTGWKAADKDVKDMKVGPQPGNAQPTTEETPKPDGEQPAAGEKPASPEQQTTH